MSKKKIAVIGAGTAGLHLGLYLRTHGVDVTIYTDRRPNEYRDIRLLNTVAHHHVTISREDMLECNHWPSDRDGYFGHYYYVGGPQPMRFYGKLGKPSRAVDYRLYHPQLMQDFVDRGGVIEYREITHDDVPEITHNHDLLVVCTGKGPFGRMFARDESESPFDRPQRALCVGLFKGIKENPIRAVTMNFSPGAGEMIEIPTISFNGMCTALVLENHVGGDLEVLANTKYDDDREAFLKLMLEKLRVHYPDCYARIDQAEFDLANGPLDILQGGVTPTVRKTHIVLDDGKVAVALGDVHAVVDPVLGQGANMASHAAVILAEEIVRQDIFDARFIEKVNARRNDRVLSGMRWTNYILDSLRTLSPDILQFIVSIAQNPDLADEFTENFNYPEHQWDCFASSRRTQDWVSTRLAGNTDSVECEKELAVAS